MLRGLPILCCATWLWAFPAAVRSESINCSDFHFTETVEKLEEQGAWQDKKILQHLEQRMENEKAEAEGLKTILEQLAALETQLSSIESLHLSLSTPLPEITAVQKRVAATAFCSSAQETIYAEQREPTVVIFPSKVLNVWTSDPGMLHQVRRRERALILFPKKLGPRGKLAIVELEGVGLRAFHIKRASAEHPRETIVRVQQPE